MSAASSASVRHDDPAQEALQATPSHILMIEDQSDARLVLAKLLECLGHRVESAEDGARGVELALANQPEIALVDIGLPDIDGYDVARQIRAELGDQIFLVVLPGFAMADDLHYALDAGFDAHLPKPADLVELERLLARGHGR